MKTKAESFFEKVSSGDFEYNCNLYWENTETAYPYYPTVRHRKRYILDAIKNIKFTKETFVFDYGCGQGSILNEIKYQFRGQDTNLGGCDLSEVAIEYARKKINSPYLYPQVFPQLPVKCDVIVCSEVIEHTEDYLEILYWIKNHLNYSGLLILTTQTGKIHASDKYTGHTQHFDIYQLTHILERLGFRIESASRWGFPFFTLQKYLTNWNFEKIRQDYLEGELSLKKRIVFKIAFWVYFLHDFINSGPQIYIQAIREKVEKEDYEEAKLTAKSSLNSSVPKILRQFVGYLFTGGSATVVDVIVFSILVSSGLWYVAALGVSFVFGVSTNFFLSRRFVFGVYWQNRLAQYTVFTIISLNTLLANLGLLKLLIDDVGWDATAARLVSAAGVALLSFTGHKLYSFSSSNLQFGARQPSP